MKLPNLSGSDYFHLLLDRKMLRNGLVGNISRIHLELASDCDLTELHSNLSSNRTLADVADLKVKISWPSLPRWDKRDSTAKSSELHSNLSQNEFGSLVLNRKVDNENGLVFIDLCELENGTKHVVISMHHVLFDHQGMMNFLQALANGNARFPLFPEKPKTSFLSTLTTAIGMTVYMLKRSSGQLGTLVQKDTKPKSNPKFKFLDFTEDETREIEKNAWNAGARIGQSPFYLASTAKSVLASLQNRGENPPYLWYSIPINQRKKGIDGHLISNQLSFLFFRSTAKNLGSIRMAVNHINEGLKQQIKDRIADRYAMLQNALRTMPLSVYEWMVNLASEGKMSSFGFSDLGEFKNPISQFKGIPILSTNHYPPVPSPPGFNVAVLKEKGQLKFVMAYFNESISESEINVIESEFRNLLLTPKV